MDNATYYASERIPLTSSNCAQKPHGSTIINMRHVSKAPNDYLVWSLCNILYVNFCCLGFLALIYSVKARDQKTLGDLRAAQECSDKAKWFNVLATGWNILVLLLLLTLLVVVLVLLNGTEGSFDLFGENGFQSLTKHFGS